MPQSNPTPNASRALRCATWIRVSTAEQADHSGIDRQKATVARVVESKGYEVVHEVELIDVSGTAVMYSPEAQVVMELIEKGAIDVIVASEMSRLLRPDDLTSFGFLDACKQGGVLVDTGGTVHDLESPEGFLSGGILGLLAGHERMAMKRRMLASKEALRARGRHPGSEITLPTGITYDRKEERYAYTGDIVKIVEAFRLIDEEGIRNLSEVARKTGLGRASMRGLLQNPLYRGERVYDQFRDQTKKVVGRFGRQKDKPKVKRPPEKVIRVRVFSPEEQAVSDERWHRVQLVLASIRNNHEVFVAERWTGNLLAGVGRCGYCGQRLYAKTRSRKLSDGTSTSGHYICGSAISTQKVRKCRQGWNRKEDLDELTEAFVQRFIADPVFVAAVLDHARSKQAGKVVGLDMGQELRSKLDDLNRRDKRILDGLESGVLSLDEAKQRRTRLAEERQIVLSSIESHQQPASCDPELAGISARITNAVKKWPKFATVKERRAALATIYAEIFFRGASITAFRLAPGLVGESGGFWAFAADMPIALESPLTLKIPEPEVIVPDGQKQCSRCKVVKPLDSFYKSRPACKECSKAYCKRYYETRKAP